MSPATRVEALIKLRKLSVKIGHPARWRDYSPMTIKRDDLVGNVMHASRFEWQNRLAKLGKPVDRTEWLATPQTTYAYYAPELNEIAIPAAIIQAPLFDEHADDAVNYGALGAAIGHEISRGLDDQGSQHDGDGNLRDGWTPQDHENVKQKAQRLIAQYNAFSPAPGHFVNGTRSLNENIADNSGLADAYKAYALSLKGKPSPVIDSMTGDQRLYYGFAQLWRSKAPEAHQVALLESDTHSPDEFRANGPVRNQPGCYEAFDVKPGDALYLPPEERVIMW